MRLVDDLLDVSRILRGKVELRRGRTDLGEAVRRAVEIAQPAIDAGRHALTVELPAEPLPVDGDPVRLAQVVSNLLHNAAKFTEPGGRIAASAERIDGRAVLRVRDTGCGIDPQLLPRVFDLFVQGDRSAARTQGGLGIGLTLARQLVELHGGTVAVQSGGPGQGSTFTVQLPLASGEGGRMEEAGARVAEPAAPTAAAPSLRVLVVDDNADAADSLAFLLNLSGHDARTFHSGPDALAAAAEFRPDAFVLDIGLPGMDGHEIARRLRAAGVGQDAPGGGHGLRPGGGPRPVRRGRVRLPPGEADRPRGAERAAREARAGGGPDPVVAHASRVCDPPATSEVRSQALLRFQQPREALPQLRHLRVHHQQAVRLVRVRPLVALVVVLRLPEPRQRRHLRDDRAGPGLPRVPLSDRGLGLPLLFGRVVEHDRAVLRPHVVPLPVECGGVVQREEDVQQLAVRDDRGVEGDLDDLGVPGRAGADPR